MEAQEESKHASDVTVTNALSSDMENNIINPDHNAPTASTEIKTPTESESKENLIPNSSNPQNSEISNELKSDDKVAKDNVIVNEENKNEKKEKEENQSEDDDSDDDEEAVLESSPCGRWHKRKEQV